MVNDFDKIAPFYDGLQKLFFGDRLLAASSYHLDRIDFCHHTLILGGGTGRILESFPGGVPITYLDKSTNMISLARGRVDNNNIEFIQADFLEWDPGYDKFDFVICPFFLDAFGRANLSLVLDKIQLIMKSGAFMIVIDFQPSEKVFNRFLLWSMHKFFRLSTALESEELRSLDKVLQDRMDLIERKEFGEMVFSAVYKKRA